MARRSRYSEPVPQVEEHGEQDELAEDCAGREEARVDVSHRRTAQCTVRPQDVPQGLKDAMAKGNRWQDLLTTSFIVGRSGNEILAATLKKSASEGLRCSVYTHPLGFFGHAAGPTIGMWDNQGPTPVRGDWPLYANTCYAIEGNIKVQLPEWGNQWIQIKLEQDAWFDGKKVTYIGGRQTRWHVAR